MTEDRHQIYGLTKPVDISHSDNIRGFAPITTCKMFSINGACKYSREQKVRLHIAIVKDSDEISRLNSRVRFGIC